LGGASFYLGGASLLDGWALGPVVALGADEGDPWGLPRSEPPIPVVPLLAPEFVIPLSMVELLPLTPD
jgi:hypothetical protein